MLLTGSATALTGAPGSVLLYGLIGLMAWPRPPRRRPAGATVPPGWRRRPPRRASAGRSRHWRCGAATGPCPPSCSCFPPTGPGRRSRVRSRAWPPALRTGTPISSPPPATISLVGTQTAWVLAIVSLVIGLGPLVARRPGLFLAAGASSPLLWITGQGLFGDTSPARDGPQHRAADHPAGAGHGAHRRPGRNEAGRSPLATVLRWNPFLCPRRGGRLWPALVLSAAYPAPAAESSTSAMSDSGMDGSSMSGNPGRRHQPPRVVHRRAAPDRPQARAST